MVRDIEGVHIHILDYVAPKGNVANRRPLGKHQQGAVTILAPRMVILVVGASHFQMCWCHSTRGHLNGVPFCGYSPMAETGLARTKTPS